ncbi:ABC transporter ATP-binding protein [Corynebacterium kroppenstedtii]|uniref:Fe(3+)-dicitrate ABC transporter ATP-binding protein n=1 Tax=Corynebacterium kroppenstedtii TaxID=161879 RepID=A0A2W5SN72_9CORY|nr:ABC transporter ATP-binding protein [Corynebacterium kroppenstedtii]MDU7286924.1 ABC transporter ATP-binding protein [Corynebacterium kroppenstedtii]PZR04382.1 MAG: Fe(3+)-dicitrate ABC transporter ATP-binding protein [Corynebacterium kroppenstedtii]
MTKDQAEQLSAESITVGYGGPAILQDVSVKAPAGKITALIGPNGCGKSTLLRALGRQQALSAGCVRVGETSIRDLSPREFARHVAFLPQQPVTPEGVTVREVVAYGRYPYTGAFASLSDRDHEAIEEAAYKAGVAGLLDELVTELSGGQRQRVWVAMTVAQQTPVLLLDEPTTYLDPAYQIAILDLVKELNAAGRTVVMVVHDMTHAARFADHIVAMRDGEVVAAGDTDEVMSTELVSDVFGIGCLSVQDPETGRVLPVPYQ